MVSISEIAINFELIYIDVVCFVSEIFRQREDKVEKYVRLLHSLEVLVSP